MEIPKPKCYLVVKYISHEPHDFDRSKVFLIKEEAEEYAKNLNEENSRLYFDDSFEVIELDLLLAIAKEK